MSSSQTTAGSAAGQATLLYDDECGVCRHIASWVRHAAQGSASLIQVRPIGEDPQALRALNPALDIWDAYNTVHLLMPDGSMRLGGQAVAELLRRLPATRWFAWCFALSIFGWRPFQQLLDLAYLILADVRPVFGCESCGTPSPWVRPFFWLATKLRARVKTGQPAPAKARQFSSR
jgi:predicted DCC family thiol-disulfide oxidoreductase YuxK